MRKSEELLARLQAGWCAANVMALHFGWKAPSFRRAVSQVAKSYNIERKRENGITFYRIKTIEAAE